MATSQQNLIRKQFLISPSQIDKVERIAKQMKVSAAEVVRSAITAYDPSELDAVNQELIDLVNEKLEGAIVATRKSQKEIKALRAELSNPKGQ